MDTAPRTADAQPTNPAVLFVVACVWAAISFTGGRLAAGAASLQWHDGVHLCATACLLFLGFYAIARGGSHDMRPLSSVGFVRRPSARREFWVGAALGWSIALALILPSVLSGNLALGIRFSTAHVGHLVRSAVVLIALALCVQMIVAGLPSRLLVRVAGPPWTVIAMMLLAFCLILSGLAGSDRGILFGVLAAALFSAAFLRTRAIWFGLGLQLGWTLVLQLLFGASSPYTPPTSGVVRSYAGGPIWLTGGYGGPEATVFAPWVLIGALILLIRLTRNYAWHYTYQPPVGAGYPVEVQPPAAHAREQAGGAEALVQIGGITSVSPSTPPERL